MFEWDKGYRLGIADVDAEHLILFSLINQLEININGEKADECVQDVLGALLSYVSLHFTREQELMKSINYPKLKEHTEQHDKFTAALKDMRENGSSGLEAAIKIRSFVLTWLVNHILREDTDYARHISGTETTVSG